MTEYISSEEKGWHIFAHKTMERLEVADACHFLLEIHGKDCEESVNTFNGEKKYKTTGKIEATKYLFREYLSQILQDQGFKFPPNYSKGKIQKAYLGSDFDWIDKRKFRNFMAWFIDC